MIIERNLPITMDDGVVLRCDVFRPDTSAPPRDRAAAKARARAQGRFG